MTFLCDEEKKQCLDLVQPRPWTEGSGSFNLCLSINIDSHVRLSAVICDTSAPPPKRIATASCCPKYAAIVMGASQYRVFRFTKFASAPAFRSTRRTSRWPSWLALKTSAVGVLQRETKYERLQREMKYERLQREMKYERFIKSHQETYTNRGENPDTIEAFTSAPARINRASPSVWPSWAAMYLRVRNSITFWDC